MNDRDRPAGVELALGRCDEVRAEVFVRGAPSSGGAPPRITGTLTGPRRGRDTTLPATARLLPTAAGGMARAIVTEPAYWTPDLPNLYRLEATCTWADEQDETVDRLVGLRRLGVRGRSLWLDGRRWVPRGVATDGTDLERCKAAQVAAVIRDPDERTLARADALGVAVMALPAAAHERDPAAIARSIVSWAAHPAAVIAVLPASIGLEAAASMASDSRDARGTLQLAAVVAGKIPPPDPIPRGVDLLVVALDDAATPHAGWQAGAAVPLIAWRGGGASPGADRGPCDALQAVLAAWRNSAGGDPLGWDWAGYVVG